MASPQCASVGIMLGLIATFGILFATGSRYWQISSQQASQQVNQGIWSYEGLWVRCTSYTKGQFQCDNFDQSYLGLPANLQLWRAMMCLASISCFISVVATTFALDCNSTLKPEQKGNVSKVAGGLGLFAASLNCQRAFMVIASIFSVAALVAGSLGQSCINALNDDKSKMYSGRSGGGLMLAAGLLTLAAVSWYAAEVVNEFWNSKLYNQTFRYEFGSALYVGWVSSGLALASGFLLLCCTPNPDETDEYSYNPPKRAMNNNRSAEYV